MQQVLHWLLAGGHERNSTKGKLKMELEIVTTGREYEEAIFRHLSNNGYTSVLTAQSGDQGVDIIVTIGDIKIAIQCKLYTKPVGNDAVQEVLAGAKYYGCTNACVVTNTSFTKSATKLAASSNVRLLNHRKLFDYLEEFPRETYPADFETSKIFNETMDKARLGNMEARKKLGIYFYSQVVKTASIDLFKSIKYLAQAVKVGNKQALEFCSMFVDDTPGLGPFFRAAMLHADEHCQPALRPLAQRIAMEVHDKYNHDIRNMMSAELVAELDWFETNRLWERLKKEPKGSIHADQFFESYGRFVDRHYESSELPNELYYLGLCYLNRVGGVEAVDEDKGMRLIERSAKLGFEPALKLMREKSI